jgi:hypothetical protein
MRNNGTRQSVKSLKSAISSWETDPLEAVTESRTLVGVGEVEKTPLL